MTAVTVETMKTVAIVVVVVLVLLAVLVAKVLASVTQKIIGVAILGALAVAVWSQRASISDCAETVKEQAETAAETQDLPDGTTCTFFGYELTVDLPG